MDEELAEDSYTFRAAIVLLAAEMVGPYTDRAATFLGYPVGFVQVIAARLDGSTPYGNFMGAGPVRQAEILALRHQLAVFQKNAPRRLRCSRVSIGSE